jgi:DNA-binding CsgD family transcriptional regulator
MSDEHPGVAAEGQPPRSAPPTITPREQEILRLIAEGLTDREIAERLWVSVHTARAHQAHLREKFQVRNRMALVHEAERLGCLTKSSQESSIIAIGEGPHPGYTQGQEVAPKPFPESPGGEASADAPGETEMLNPRLRFWYLAALLALSARHGAAAAEASSDRAGSMVARRVWAGPKVDLFTSPSPDGRYLALVDWGTGDLALRDLATGKSRRLTNKGSWSDSSEWALYGLISPAAQTTKTPVLRR